MKVAQLKEIIKNFSDDDDIVAIVYEKQEIDDRLEYLNDEETPVALNNVEWLHFVHKIESDEGIWDEISNALHYHLEQLTEKRAKK